MLKGTSINISSDRLAAFSCRLHSQMLIHVCCVWLISNSGMTPTFQIWRPEVPKLNAKVPKSWPVTGLMLKLVDLLSMANHEPGLDISLSVFYSLFPSHSPSLLLFSCWERYCEAVVLSHRRVAALSLPLLPFISLQSSLLCPKHTA